MGVDIHTALQVKQQGRWETIATNIYDGRNYALFGVLAGVRGQEEPIVEPRGYPKGFMVDEDNGHPIADEAGFMDTYWMGNFGHSWLTLEEINDRRERDTYDNEGGEEKFDYFIGLRYIVSKMIVLAYDQGYVDNFEDVRLVFGFDA